MSPEYLRELADLADPKELWRLSGMDKMNLPPEDKRQLDMGVALRRHATHIEVLRGLIGTGKSLLMTPIGPNSKLVDMIPTPNHHLRLLNKGS